MKVSKEFSLAALAKELEGELEGDGEIIIRGIAPIESAGAGDLTFVANKGYLKYLPTTKASAVILSPDIPKPDIAVIRHAKPYLTFAHAIDIIYPLQPQIEAGTNNHAVIEEHVKLDPTSAVGPLCHVRSGSTIGAGTQLVSSVFVGQNVSIGKNCLIYPGVRILDGSQIGNNVIIHASTVIGSDGFGYAESPTGLKKIQQIGWVEIDDNVEIGSNVSIDRGALGATKIGAGTKIDNLVQIAHNVEIGSHSLIISQVGIAGSTKVGSQVILAGQVGLIGHLNIGDKVQVAAQSGVKHDLEAGKKYYGSPAREFMEEARIESASKKLPELLKRVSKIEKKLSD